MPTAKSAIQILEKMLNYPRNPTEEGFTNVFSLGLAYLPPSAGKAPTGNLS